jgi:hypothetical protein
VVGEGAWEREAREREGGRERVARRGSPGKGGLREGGRGKVREGERERAREGGKVRWPGEGEGGVREGGQERKAGRGSLREGGRGKEARRGRPRGGSPREGGRKRVAKMDRRRWLGGGALREGAREREEGGQHKCRVWSWTSEIITCTTLKSRATSRGQRLTATRGWEREAEREGGRGGRERRLVGRG